MSTGKSASIARTTSALARVLSLVARARAPIVACFLAGLLGAILAVITGSPRAKGTDFFYYFCVSKLVGDGHGGSIYDPHALGVLERVLAFPSRVPNGLIPNVYPPFFAVALAPLTKVPYDIAFSLWLGLNCCLFALSILYLMRYAGLSTRAQIVTGCTAAVSSPVIVAMLLGQVSFVLLALFTVVFVKARTGREALAGVALGLTLIKPQFVLPFLVLFLIHRRWRLLASFCATAAMLLAAPMAVLGWRIDLAYVRTLAKAATWGANVGGFAPHWNRSFAGLTRLLLPSPASTIVDVLLIAAILVMVAVAAWQSDSVDLPFGLCIVGALLVSQHVLLHDLTLLLIPGAIVWRHGKRPVQGTIMLGVLVYASMFVGFDTSVTHSVQLPTIAMSILAIRIFLLTIRERTTGPQVSGYSLSRARGSTA